VTARAALSLRRPEALRAALGKWEKMRKNLDAETSALIEPVKPPPHQDRLITVREAARQLLYKQSATPARPDFF